MIVYGTILVSPRYDASRRGKKGLKPSRDIIETTHRSAVVGRGWRSLRCHPGSELAVVVGGGRSKKGEDSGKRQGKQKKMVFVR